jgi:hypothetical protein
MTDKEQVLLELPKNIMEYVRASCLDPRGYLQARIVEVVRSDLDNQAIVIQNLTEKYTL